MFLKLIKDLFTPASSTPRIQRLREDLEGEQRRRRRDRHITSVRQMLEQARERQAEVERNQRAMNLDEFLNTNNEENVARMRAAHLSSNHIQWEEPEEPTPLELDSIVDGILQNVPITEVIRSLALEVMTLRDEVGTLEERLATAEYYSEAS